MFTGIITEIGTIASVRREGGGFRMSIQAPGTARGLSRGGSVAVDGICLTAVDVERSGFSVEVVPETSRRTRLGTPRKGLKVNLERPLKADGELSGHFVQGHVDAAAEVLGISRLGKDVVLAVKLPGTLRGLIVEKGSIALNGVSLTVASVRPDRFTVALIPFTLKETNLGDLKKGDEVNLEADLLGKYVRALLPKGRRAGKGRTSWRV